MICKSAVFHISLFFFFLESCQVQINTIFLTRCPIALHYSTTADTITHVTPVYFTSECCIIVILCMCVSEFVLV